MWKSTEVTEPSEERLSLPRANLSPQQPVSLCLQPPWEEPGLHSVEGCEARLRMSLWPSPREESDHLREGRGVAEGGLQEQIQATA